MKTSHRSRWSILLTTLVFAASLAHAQTDPLPSWNEGPAKYAEKVHGIPPEQVIGTAGATKFGYDKNGRPFLTKEPRLTLNDNNGGKAEGIHLMIGRRPYAAFGNTAGDQQMLEYTGAGDGARLMMLVLHDDGVREYAYGPATGLPDTKVGAFGQKLYDEAKSKGWTVISMKNDWKRIFAFE